jgi:hypothetical protein
MKRRAGPRSTSDTRAAPRRMGRTVPKFPIDPEISRRIRLEVHKGSFMELGKGIIPPAISR